MENKLHQQKILIVDDAPENIDVFGGLLLDYKRIFALNGKDALNKARSDNPPDLILLDIVMPEIDGYEVCRRLKADEKTRNIPIIFITGLSEEEDEIKGFELGAVDFITKPVSPPVVKARVKTHLMLKLAREELEQRIDEIARLRRESEAFLRHELNNRLMPFIGYSELLLLTAKEHLSETEIIWLSNLLKSANDMASLIKSLRKLQDFDAGIYDLDLSQFDLEDLVNEVITQLEMSQDKVVKVLYRSNLNNGIIYADRNLLSGVFHNLIKNAIEHVSASEDESQKIVRIDLNNEDDKIVARINNLGESIPPERISTFFEKFNTDKTRKKNGMGLGTTYAYLVTKAHGGEIYVTSNREEGTTLTVKLPNHVATV